MRFDGNEGWLAFGTLGRPHGVRGEVYLHAYNSHASVPALLRCPMGVRLVSGSNPTKATILSFKGREGRFLISFEEMRTRESIAALVNTEVQLPLTCFPALNASEFYVEDLRECDVFSIENKALGTVKSVYWNGAQDVARIVSEDGNELLVPIVDRFVVSLDRKLKRLVVDWHE